MGALRPGVPHFANDVAVDAQGNAYVTDSFAPIIYKIDAQGIATVFLENSRFAAPAGSFGLNGIVYHPDGYLLVSKWDEGLLFKIPLAAPAAFTQVATNAAYRSADGLLLTNSNTLLIAANGLAPAVEANTNTVFRVSSPDGWATAATTGSMMTGDVFPTALARRGGDVYLLQSHVNALLSGQNPPATQFGLQKVVF